MKLYSREDRKLHTRVAARGEVAEEHHIAGQLLLAIGWHCCS